jgi:hypothetical protein
MTTNGHKKGFRIAERTGRLIFEDDYAGAEVAVRLDVPLAVYIDLAKGAESESPAEIAAAFEKFSRDVLREWNLEDDAGEPLAVHPAGMLAIPLDFAMFILTKWIEVAAKSPLVQTHSKSSTSSARDGGRRRR